MIATKEELERDGWTIGPDGDMSRNGQSIFAVYTGQKGIPDEYVRYRHDSNSGMVIEAKVNARGIYV